MRIAFHFIEVPAATLCLAPPIIAVLWTSLLKAERAHKAIEQALRFASDFVRDIFPNYRRTTVIKRDARSANHCKELFASYSSFSSVEDSLRWPYAAMCR
jgi:hypothetical protein